MVRTLGHGQLALLPGHTKLILARGCQVAKGNDVTGLPGNGRHGLAHLAGLQLAPVGRGDTQLALGVGTFYYYYFLLLGVHADLVAAYLYPVAGLHAKGYGGQRDGQ